MNGGWRKSGAADKTAEHAVAERQLTVGLELIACSRLYLLPYILKVPPNNMKVSLTNIGILLQSWITGHVILLST